MSDQTEAQEAKVATASQEELTEWFNLQAQLSEVKEKEMALRKKIFGDAFPDPKEGTNDFPLPGGFVLKGKHKINREVDEAMLAAKQEQLLKAGVPIAALIKNKPELITKAYRALDDKKRILFEQILDIKVGAPALEIVKPKR